jgi:putative intracellular protease/amidase
MGKILCFVSDDLADFEITHALHKLKTAGKREIVAIGYDFNPVVSKSGLTYLPDQAVTQALDLADVEGLLIPGGAIRPQKPELTQLIQKLDREKRLLAAICNGPQYLGRAGILDRHSYTTSYGLDKAQLLGKANPFPSKNYVEQRVVRDGHVITAKGRAFVDFSFAIFDYLDVYAGRAEEKEGLYADIMDR